MSDQDSVVQLREYIERIFDERQLCLNQLLDAHAQAVKSTAKALERRLDILNHWREEVVKDRELMRTELVSDREKFLPKILYDQMHRSIEARLDRVEQSFIEKLTTIADQWDSRIVSVEKTQARYIGMGLILIPLAGILGGLVTHVFFK